MGEFYGVSQQVEWLAMASHNGPAAPARTPEKAIIHFEERLSDSPYIERVWRSHSEQAGEFLSVAASHFEVVVTRHQGKTFLTIRGPETRASIAHCPSDGEWLGIRFKLGTFMPLLPPRQLRDRNDVTLPDSGGKSFLLDGTAWQYPDFGNAETFVCRLARSGTLSRDPVLDAAVEGKLSAASLRSIQRHFLKAAGISHAAYRQIERARYAANLLREGRSIIDVTHLTGYYDQAHLTRSLKRLIGETPADILQARSQLSFLYKTAPPK